jgi:hypothetical protein
VADEGVKKEGETWRGDDWDDWDEGWTKMTWAIGREE